MIMWKRGRAVECTGLENRQGRESFVSSNLTASATPSSRAFPYLHEYEGSTLMSIGKCSPI